MYKLIIAIWFSLSTLILFDTGDDGGDNIKLELNINIEQPLGLPRVLSLVDGVSTFIGLLSLNC